MFEPGIGRKEKFDGERKITFPFLEKERKEKSKIFRLKKRKKEKYFLSFGEKWKEK